MTTPRQFQVNDPDWGIYKLYCIKLESGSEDPETERQEDARYPKGFEVFDPLVKGPLRDISSLFSRVSLGAYLDALQKYPLPLIKQLGISPQGCLLKCPPRFLQCSNLGECAMYTITNSKVCEGQNTSNLRTCYQAQSGTMDIEFDHVLSKILHLWRSGIYVVTVEPT